MTKITNRTVALAGVYQAAVLVDKLAKTGTADSDSCNSSYYSLFQMTQESSASTYGGIEGVRLGLMALRKQLTDPDRENLDVPKYALTLLHLADKLKKEPGLVGMIRDGISQASDKLNLYDHTHSNQVATLADLYRQTISHIPPRVMVQGQPLYLQNPDTQNRIRALLLAGVRSALLWQEHGGSRLQLLFYRRPILAEAERLLREITGE